MSLLSLHAQTSESVTLDRLIQNAITRNPEITNDSTRKVLVLKIEKIWYNWLYSLNTAGILNEYNNLLSDLDRIARLRYESGDIDYIQFATVSNITAEITTNKAIFENKCQQYKNALVVLTLNDSDIFPADTLIDLYEIKKAESLETKSSTDSLTLYRESANNMEIENLRLELDNLFIRLHYYRSSGLAFAEGIRATAMARLKSEDIEYLEYAGYLEKSLNIQLEFLKVLNQYNQCAIQLEEYAY